MADFSLLDERLGPPPEESQEEIIEISEDQIDPRYTLLSYSSLLTLHECPRKFQLMKLGVGATDDPSTSVTFAYGHAVGAGAALYLVTRNLDAAIWEAFLAWDVDFEAVNEKQKKSFPYVVLALEIFAQSQEFDDMEVVSYEGMPALELSFKVTFPGELAEFSMRGFLDALLREQDTGQLFVFEHKTSSGNYVNPVGYKNSSQGVGYSVIVDKIAPEASSYEIKYSIYMTKLFRYEHFNFLKSKFQKAMWIRDIFHDISQIEYYVKMEGNYGHWPMRGESCVSFGRPCQYLDICELKTENLMKPCTASSIKDHVDAQFVFTVEEILNG